MSRLLEPKTLMAIKNLPLAAKTTVEGTMAGLHRSNAKGAGMEFSQYRSYQPGDDLRSLDWKMFARSDRYYIREAETDTSIAVKILIDASASMNHQDGAFTKLDYARYLAASLAYLAAQQGDAVGLYIFEEGRLFTLPARNGPQQMARLYHELENVQAGGHFTEEISYKNLFSNSPQKELLIFVTDYYERQGEITKMLHLLASLRQDITVLHLIGNNELELDYKGYSAVEDLETGQVIRMDPQRAKAVYQQSLQQHLSAVRTGLLEKNIYYRLMNMNEPIDTALRDFLTQRNQLKS
jgi:uncharacterized protein (DUF58 family)